MCYTCVIGVPLHRDKALPTSQRLPKKNLSTRCATSPSARIPKPAWAVAIALGCPRPWWEDPAAETQHFHGHRTWKKIKLALTGKLPPRRLVFTVLEGSIQAARGAVINSLDPAVNPARNNKDWPGKIYPWVQSWHEGYGVSQLLSTRGKCMPGAKNLIADLLFLWLLSSLHPLFRGVPWALDVGGAL